MTPEIPQSARDALARQTATEEHPSADLLNGFVERALSAAEEKRVTAHLAACAECREVVFLAGAAADHPVAAAAGYEPVGTKARGRWRSWRWLAPVLAMAVVVAGIVVERQRSSTAHPAVGQTLAMNQSSAALMLQSSKPAPDKLKAAAASPPAAISGFSRWIATVASAV